MFLMEQQVNSVSNDRWQGAEEVFSQYPDIEIVGEAYGEWDYAKGKAATESLLSANPEIDAVWSQGGAMTQGAVDAFVAAGEKACSYVRRGWKRLYQNMDPVSGDR